jgi:hypothetical protein
MMNLKLLEKQGQNKPKISRQKEVIKIMQKSNKWKLKEQYEESMK